MDERRRMVLKVLDGTLSVSAASREFGVSRQVVRVWVARALEQGLEHLSEYSRRPLTSPRGTDVQVVEQILSLAKEYEDWGSRKIWALMGGTEAPVTVRTVDRILGKHGRRILPPRKASEPIQRFAKDLPNELWQADFKHMGPRQNRSTVLSVVDDATRFNVGLIHVPNETFQSTWTVLWNLFGEYGLPEGILTDNGPAFRSNATWRYGLFDLKLMLLDIRPSHGRPRHPQTQGKVERFHRTLEWELGRKFMGLEELDPLLEVFRTRYNWVRHHDAIETVPGAIYKPSIRPRPKSMPEPFFPKDALVKVVTKTGHIHLKGKRYDLGNALANLPIGLIYDEFESPKVAWGNYILGRLHDFQTGKDVLS
jgi:transposase InsO family protein